MKTISFFRTNAMLVVALLTAGITMSFQIAENSQNADDVVYHYIGTDMTENFNDVNNWSTINNSNPCGVEKVLPCKITLPENVSLSSVLGSNSNSIILDLSEGFKSEP
ncbi:hypothetical protein [Chryseobacterium sp. A321]